MSKREHNQQESAYIEKITLPVWDEELARLKDSGIPTEQHVLPGKFTWIKGFIYPYKGLPHQHVVTTLAVFKKLIPGAIIHLVNKKTVALLGIILIFSKKTFKKMVWKIVDMFLYTVFRPLYQYKVAPKKYCRAVREIYRVFNILIDREMPLDSELRGRWIRLRDFICIALEYDNAYRYRFQDALSELNLDEIKMDDGDWYFVCDRSDYDFGGKSLNQRRKELKKMVKSYMESDATNLDPRNEVRLREITPDFQKEVIKLCEKYGVQMEPFLYYTESGMSPQLRIKLAPQPEKTPREIEIEAEVNRLEREKELIQIQKGQEKKIEEKKEDLKEDDTTHK